MKKRFLSGLFYLFCVVMTGFAQEIVKPVSYPEKNPQLALNVQGVYNGYPYPGNVGVGFDAKAMFNAQQNADAYNQYVITFKGTHTVAANGPTWGSFDNGEYNNVSALIILAGYRFNFGTPRYIHQDFKRETGGWFIEINGGGAYYRFAKTLRPTVSPLIGCAIAPKLEVVASYTGSWISKKGKSPLAVFGMGLQYKF